MPPILTKVSYYKMDGMKFATIQKMCDHYGIRKKTYEQRVDGGMFPYEALTKPVRKQRAKP